MSTGASGFNHSIDRSKEQFNCSFERAIKSTGASGFNHSIDGLFFRTSYHDTGAPGFNHSIDGKHGNIMIASFERAIMSTGASGFNHSTDGKHEYDDGSCINIPKGRTKKKGFYLLLVIICKKTNW